jgi:hypothetical protein
MRRGSCSSQRDDKAPARSTDVLAALDTISDCGADGLGRSLVVEQKADGKEVQLSRYRSAVLLPGARSRGESELATAQASAVILAASSDAKS